MEHCSTIKEQIANYMQQLEIMLVNKAKRLHAILFHLCNILKWQNHRNGEQISRCQGLRTGGDSSRGRCGYEGEHAWFSLWWASSSIPQWGYTKLHVIKLQRTEYTQLHIHISTRTHVTRGFCIKQTDCTHATILVVILHWGFASPYH